MFCYISPFAKLYIFNTPFFVTFNLVLHYLFYHYQINIGNEYRLSDFASSSNFLWQHLFSESAISYKTMDKIGNFKHLLGPGINLCRGSRNESKLTLGKYKWYEYFTHTRNIQRIVPTMYEWQSLYPKSVRASIDGHVCPMRRSIRRAAGAYCAAYGGILSPSCKASLTQAIFTRTAELQLPCTHMLIPFHSVEKAVCASYNHHCPASPKCCHRHRPPDSQSHHLYRYTCHPKHWLFGHWVYVACTNKVAMNANLCR